jgi:anti-sigma regulatory factor (Ser/Thr protein kinase)
VSRTVELRFPAVARYLVLARLGVTGLGAVARLDESTLADLKLAVTEACANAVRHAYADDDPGDVRLRMKLEDDGSLVVEVSDEGGGFDITGVRRWDPSSMRESGMGFEIMRSIVDDVEIESAPSSGTVVRLRKHLVPTGSS